MKFFIDTADVSEIKELSTTGLLDGVTTNPTLIRKSGRDFLEVIAEICKIVPGPVSAEVTALESDAMIRQARRLAAIAPNVVAKLPLTWEGLKACRALTAEKIRTNVTLCFSSGQGLLAAKAGATYISPFIGRLDDIEQDGIELVRHLRTIYDNYDLPTQILAASIRSPLHIRDAALAGADVVTVPPAILKQAVRHPLTDKGLETFMADWAATGQKLDA